MYQERMINYYPQVIQKISEFQAIINAEYPEFEDLEIAKDRIVQDAYLPTMNRERIIEWERVLQITPSITDSLESRRANVIARLRAIGKLNTALIASIVNAFTNGTAESWVEDGVLYINVIPNPESFKYDFMSVAKEIKRKIPAHLGGARFSITSETATDSTLYVACAITHSVRHEMSIKDKVLTDFDMNLISSVVITHGQTYYMGVLEK